MAVSEWFQSISRAVSEQFWVTLRSIEHLFEIDIECRTIMLRSSQQFQSNACSIISNSTGCSQKYSQNMNYSIDGAVDGREMSVFSSRPH